MLCLLLLAHNQLSGASPGARVSLCPLPVDRQPETMPLALIRTNVNEPLYVHRHLTPEITLHLKIPVDHISYLNNILISQILNPYIRVNPCLAQYLLRQRSSNAKYSCKTDFYPLVLG